MPAKCYISRLVRVPCPRPAAAWWDRPPLLWAQPQVYVLFACLRTSKTEADSQMAGYICMAEAKMMGFFPSPAYSLISRFFLYTWCQTVVAINSFFLPSDSHTYRPTAPKQKYNFFFWKNYSFCYDLVQTEHHSTFSKQCSCHVNLRKVRGGEGVKLFYYLSAT